jgi:hypothetical protein
MGTRSPSVASTTRFARGAQTLYRSSSLRWGEAVGAAMAVDDKLLMSSRVEKGVEGDYWW